MSSIHAHPTGFPVLQPLLGDTFVLAKCAPTFDFSDESPGNGYRSVLQVVYSCLAVMAQSLDYCLNYRNHVLVCWFGGVLICRRLVPTLNYFAFTCRCCGRAPLLTGKLSLNCQFNINNISATLTEYTSVLETLLQVIQFVIKALSTSTCDCIFGELDR